MSDIGYLEGALSALKETMQAIDRSGLSLYRELAALHEVRESLEEVLEAAADDRAEYAFNELLERDTVDAYLRMLTIEKALREDSRAPEEG